MQRANAWSQLVIGAAIEVHQIKGPGHYMKLLNKPLGLLINFHQLVLRDGIHRMIILKDGGSL
jgi:hypothetical protein